jgi:glycosyltransferase involved in cell wall biosynthesis
MDNRLVVSYALGQSDAIGGAERQKWLLACALARRGHEVVICCRAAAPRPEQKRNGVRIKWITPLSPLLAWPKILWTERPDWWYWFGRDFYLGWIGLLCRVYPTKLAFGVASDADFPAQRAPLRRKYMWPAYALGVWLAHRILILHPGQMNLLPPGLRQRARYAPSLAGPGSPAPARGDYVAWVAVLREPKRPHLLPEIARLLPHVRFVVCGPPTLDHTPPAYMAAIQAWLEACPNIDYRGQVSPEAAQRVMSEAAVFLSTSAVEGLPNTFLQSWGAGVPVVSLELDPGGLIERNTAGLVAQTVEECAQAVARLLADDALNREMGANGRRYVTAEHNEEHATAIFLSALGVDRVAAG